MDAAAKTVTVFEAANPGADDEKMQTALISKTDKIDAKRPILLMTALPPIGIKNRATNRRPIICNQVSTRDNYMS
jgi:hypothetical protein